MFQYAAARTLAERRGLPFCHFPQRASAFYLRQARKRIPQYLRGNVQAPSKQLSRADLSHYFTLEGESRFSRAARRLRWQLALGQGKSQFSPARKAIDERYEYEIFDDRLDEIGSWTKLAGSFQSDGYFAGNEDTVRRWFALRARLARRLAAIDSAIAAPQEKRCCLHIRRGDQLTHDKGLAWRDQGWVLPLDYYRAAAASLPQDTFYVVVTDSPDYAEQALDFLPNRLVMRGNSEAIDMHLFGRCRHNIIANSTFSWWGAWLNERADRNVIAPNYHMGWARRCWIPWSYERHPQDWAYIDVLETVGEGAPATESAAGAD